MKKTKTFMILNAFIVMSACGGGGGGGNAGAGGSAQDAIDYTPVYASDAADTTADAIDTTGVTGVMSQANISVSSVSTGLRSISVRISADGNTAFLTVDGATQSLPVVISTPGGGQFGNVPNNVLQVTSSNGTHDLVSFSGTSGTGGFAGFGFIGIETPLSELPTGNATYTGNWGGQAYSKSNNLAGSGVLSGTMSVMANFGSGSVTGSFTGSVNAGDTGDFAGTVSGNTSGNGVIGSMDITSGDFTGSMPIAAKTFGFDGSDLAGVFAGDIRSTGSGNNYATTGTFSLD